MKIRNSFVSNSSSSSFIIRIIEDNTYCDRCGQYLPDSIFKKLSNLKLSGRDKDPVPIETQKDIMSNAEDFEELNEIKNEILDDFRGLYLIEIEDSNGDRRDLLYKSEKIELIHEIGIS